MKKIENFIIRKINIKNKKRKNKISTKYFKKDITQPYINKVMNANINNEYWPETVKKNVSGTM